VSKYYILKERQPVEAHDALEWGRWFEKADRRVALTEGDIVSVSTVFLGLDHQFDGNGPPLLFETMIFGGPRDEETHRYGTWEEAEAGHKALVEELTKVGIIW